MILTSQKVNITKSSTVSAFRQQTEVFLYNDWDAATGVFLYAISGAVTNGRITIKDDFKDLLKSVPVQFLVVNKYDAGISGDKLFIPFFTPAKGKKLYITIEGDAITSDIDFDFIFRLENGVTKPKIEVNFQTEKILIGGSTTSLQTIITLDNDFENVSGFAIESGSSGGKYFDITMRKDDGTTIFENVSAFMFEQSENAPYIEKCFPVDFPARGSRFYITLTKVRTLATDQVIETIFKIERQYK